MASDQQGDTWGAIGIVLTVFGGLVALIFRAGSLVTRLEALKADQNRLDAEFRAHTMAAAEELAQIREQLRRSEQEMIRIRDAFYRIQEFRERSR